MGEKFIPKLSKWCHNKMEAVILLGIIGGMLFMVVVALLLVVLVKMVSIYNKTKSIIATVEEKIEAITGLIINEKKKKEENVIDSEDIR